MIERVLRLIPQFRDLETMVLVAAEEARNLDCDLEASRLEVASLQRDVASLEGELETVRDACSELTTEKLLLEDRLNSALDDKQQLWAQMQEALNNERDALRMQVNHAIQKTGGGIPYPDSHSLPPNVVPVPQRPGAIGRSGRMLTSQAAAIHNRRFIMEELLPKLNKDAQQ